MKRSYDSPPVAVNQKLKKPFLYVVHRSFRFTTLTADNNLTRIIHQAPESLRGCEQDEGEKATKGIFGTLSKLFSLLPWACPGKRSSRENFTAWESFHYATVSCSRNERSECCLT